MKVLMIISKIEPSEEGVLVGGSVNALVNLCHALPEDIQVTVLTASRRVVAHLVPAFFPPRVEVQVLLCRSPAQSIRYGVEFLLRTLWWSLSSRSRRFEVVHGHSGYAVYALVTWLVGVVIRARKVQTLYCPIDSGQRVLGKEPGPLREAWSVWGLNRLDALISMSRNVEASVTRAGVFRPRQRLLSTAIDVERYRGIDRKHPVRKRLGLRVDARVLAFVGNLTESKGIWDLLEAMSEVKARFPDAVLVVTLELKHHGFDAAKQRFDQVIAARGLEGTVVVLGFIDFMPDLLASSDLVVVPYRDTQGPSDYPLVLLEAMACGTPVLGTAVGGIPELLDNGNNGTIVPARQPAVLAQGVCAVLEEPERASRLADCGRAFVERRFSYAKSGQEHAALYRELMAKENL